MSAKNIWIFNHYAIPPDQPGGTRHFDLARQLVLKGNKVTVFAAGFNHYTHEEFISFGKKNCVIQEIEGVEFCWFKTPYYDTNNWRRVRNMMSFTFQSLRKGKKMQRPDIIIGSSVHLFAVWSAQRLANYFKVPFIMEVRDIWPQTLIDMGMKAGHPFIRVLAYLEKKLYRAADHIITLLPNAADHIRQFGVSEEKISWISNGANIPEKLLAGTRDAHKDTLVIKYAGSIGLANNMDVLLDAANELRNEAILIEIYGDGPLKPELEERSKQQNLTNVHFMGSFPKHKVHEILSSADVLYVGLKDIPLYRFGISFNKLFDYMAVAKPIIFACKTFNDPVADADCGVTIAPGNVAALTETIRQFAKLSVEKREAMGMKGYQYVKANFSTKILADKLDAILEKALAK